MKANSLNAENYLGAAYRVSGLVGVLCNHATTWGFNLADAVAARVVAVLFSVGNTRGHLTRLGN